MSIRHLQNLDIGIDLGLTKLVYCSDGSQMNNPRFGTNKKTKRTLKISQRRISRTKKGSKNRKIRVVEEPNL